MKHAVSVVADLSGGDAEMRRVVQETIAGLGGLDIIVNKCAAHLNFLFGMQSHMQFSAAYGRVVMQ